MTPQELRMLALIAEGMTTREIALRLRRQYTGTRKAVTRIFRKLGVENRTQAAVLYALRYRT